MVKSSSRWPMSVSTASRISALNGPVGTVGAGPKSRASPVGTVAGSTDAGTAPGSVSSTAVVVAASALVSSASSLDAEVGVAGDASSVSTADSSLLELQAAAIRLRSSTTDRMIRRTRVVHHSDAVLGSRSRAC